MSFPPVPGADGFLYALKLRAATGLDGYTLADGTGDIISWTAPDDGRPHRVTTMASLDVTSDETGGNIRVGWTYPDGDGDALLLCDGGQTAGNNEVAEWSRIIKPGSTVTISQSVALTAGAATVWAEIWGS